MDESTLFFSESLMVPADLTAVGMFIAEKSRRLPQIEPNGKVAFIPVCVVLHDIFWIMMFF